MGKGKTVALMGVTISITWIMLIASFFFIKSISILWETWFGSHAFWIAIVSGIVVLIGVITHMISIRALASNTKGIFS